MPIGHFGLNVADLEVARAYYEQLMPAVDFELFISDSDQFAYRPANGKPGTYLFVYGSLEPGDYSRDRTGLQHVAFMLRTRAAVDRVRDLVVGLGSEVIHEPRDFPEYPQPYYATFWLDPHGFMLEAVCHHESGGGK
jgi:catechol 2,3-dioxygenase-like lactoylglutathione lyase family enzyme